MFSIRQKREISDAVQRILRSTDHPELPDGEIEFHLNVKGAEAWSWADIQNNGAISEPDVNTHNETMDTRVKAWVSGSVSEVLISDLEVLAKYRDQQAIVAFGVQRDGTITCVTYGEDKLKCDAAGWWGQGFLKKGLSIVPFATVFGWGNKGVPVELTGEQIDELKKLDIPKQFFRSFTAGGEK